MAKTSIFSNKYAEKMRRRKINYAIIIIIIIAVLFALFFHSNIKRVGSKIFNIRQNNAIIKNKENKSVDDKNETSKGVTKTETSIKVEEEKGYVVKLSNGKQIKLVYEEKDNNKTFKYVSPINSGVVTDISPSKKAIVILDSNQDILYYDIEGKEQDLTKREYLSSGVTPIIYTKENQLNKNPNYIWDSSPKFLDEGEIAYISQLPWFNKATRYVWIINVKSGEHVLSSPIEKLAGKDLSFGDLNEKGLLVKTTGKTYYLNSDGSSTEK